MLVALVVATWGQRAQRAGSFYDTAVADWRCGCRSDVDTMIVACLWHVPRTAQSHTHRFEYALVARLYPDIDAIADSLRQAEARAVCCGLRRLVGELLQTVLSDGASDMQTTAPEVKRTGSTYKRGRASDDRVFAVRHLERRRRGCTRLPIEFAPSGSPRSRELRPSRPNLRSVVVYLAVLRCGKGADGRDQRAISWCTRGA